MLHKLIEMSTQVHNFFHDHLMSIIAAIIGYSTPVILMSSHIEGAEKAGWSALGMLFGVILVTFYKALLEDDLSKWLKRRKSNTKTKKKIK